MDEKEASAPSSCPCCKKTLSSEWGPWNDNSSDELVRTVEGTMGTNMQGGLVIMFKSLSKQVKDNNTPYQPEKASAETPSDFHTDYSCENQ